MQTIDDQYRLARQRGVPIVAITTPDPSATIERLVERALNGDADVIPIIRWQIAGGFAPYNQAGAQALANILPDGLPPDAVTRPTEAMALAANLPPQSILCAENLDAAIAGDSLEAVAVAQAIRNLRDPYKSAPAGMRCRQLVLLCPSIQLPLLLQDDVLVLEEPLPTRDELRRTTISIYQAAGQDCDDDAIEAAIDAIAGLSAFAAEQALALSITRSGMDLDRLRARKRQMVAQTQGLSIRSDSTGFEAIGGCENIKGFLRRLIGGARRPKAVLFIDEIEKALAGASSDSTGVTQDFLGAILTWMQERITRSELAGMIFIGPPGTAKSAVATAVGHEAGCLTIQMDLGGMKGKWVGQSEATIRRGLQVVDAVGQGSVLVIATCNSIGALPPELRRRFGYGTYYFDLPTPEERELIWRIYVERFAINLNSQERPADDGWTGAEIRQCCELADALGCSLREAASYIVPVSVSARDAVESLRAQADGRYISASAPGVYRRAPVAATTTGRGLVLE